MMIQKKILLADEFREIHTKVRKMDYAAKLALDLFGEMQENFWAQVEKQYPETAGKMMTYNRVTNEIRWEESDNEKPRI